MKKEWSGSQHGFIDQSHVPIYVLTWENGIEDVVHVRIFKEGHMHYMLLKPIQLLISLKRQKAVGRSHSGASVSERVLNKLQNL